jgi:SAM-dependent methyltransferase
MGVFKDSYIVLVHKLAGVLWGIRYNPKKYWSVRGLVYKKAMEQAFENDPDCDRNRSLVLETLKEYRFSSLLDVGCGYGLYLKSIEDNLDLERIDGCDISPTQVKAAKEYLGATSKVNVTETDGENLPYPDNSFDITLTYGVCIHVPHDKITHFIEEILRVTRKHYIFLESSLGADFLYYVSHDYPAIFNSLQIPIKALKEIDGGWIRVADLSQAGFDTDQAR